MSISHHRIHDFSYIDNTEENLHNKIKSGETKLKDEKKKTKQKKKKENKKNTTKVFQNKI